MRVTGTLHRDHVVASIIVVLVHLLLGWALVRLMHSEFVPASKGEDSYALRVEFIRRPALAERVHSGRPSPSAAGAPIGGDRPGSTAAQSPPTPAARRSDEMTEPAPMSAVLLGQAQQWAEQQARSEAAPTDAFERINPLSDELRPRRGHFRFRQPTSVASVVGAIGKAFSPPGYEADPCLQNRRNIAELSPQGDSAALQYEVEFDRRHCRP